MAWSNPSAALAQYRRELADGTTEKSAELAAIRDAVGVGLRTALPLPPGQPGLTTAFGHQPGAIGAVPPFGLSLWETAFTPTLGYSPTSGAPGTYLDAGGGEIEAEATLAVIIAVAVKGPDLARLQAAAEAWEAPLFWWLSDNPTLDDTVSNARWAGFGCETFPWGDLTYYCGVARVRVTIIR